MGALISATILFLLGLLAVTDFVTKQIPATADLVEKINPIRGWLGLGFVAVGIFNLINALRLIEATGTLKGMIFWITLMVIAGLEIGVGLLVGFEKIAALTGKGDNLQPLREKLAPHQRNMGFLCLIMAVWAIVFSVVF